MFYRKMTHSIQEAYPLRQKGIHFVNPSSMFDAAYKIFYNFMSSKIKKRVSVIVIYLPPRSDICQRLIILISDFCS